jgi:hypothetical protein
LPTITGGSAAERRLLARIVRAMGTTEIRKLTVSPAPQSWHPVKPGDVQLTATLAQLPGHGENSRGEWEGWIVGGAFRDRSAALGLPRVLVVISGDGDRVSPPNSPLLPPADPARLAAFRRRVEQALQDVDGRVVALRTGMPDGYSIDVTLRVRDPVRFLRRQLDPLEGRLQALHGDGLFVQLMERDGRQLYTFGTSLRLGSGLVGVSDRRYEGCIVVGHPGPAIIASAPPCPGDYRLR